MGVDIKDTDVVFRCNVVTVTDEERYEDKKIIDHSADEITTDEARELIKAVNDAFKNDFLTFYPGVSYRHAMVWANGSTNVELVPPHDILERRIGDYIPKGDGADIIYDMMKKSYDILKDHPVNVDRIKRGLNPQTQSGFGARAESRGLKALKSFTVLTARLFPRLTL